MTSAQRPGWVAGLDAAACATLYRISDDTLVWCTGEQRGSFSFEPYVLGAALRVPCATFVTLLQGGVLRGCIGSLQAQSPLYRSIHDNSLGAARQDPRFAPLQAEELAATLVKLSVLSPLSPLAGPEAIIPGVHGVVFEKDGHRAVFLPEVAVEQGWDTEALLDALCRKAGLNAGAWRRGGSLCGFFSEVLVRPGGGRAGEPAARSDG